MYALKLLHNHIKKSCSNIHSYRLTSLMVGVEALLRGDKLTVTGLGRSVNSDVASKHTIKRMDRLVGNKLFHGDRLSIYQSIIYFILKTQLRPSIIVDWSDLSHCGKYHMLRASVIAKGRSITLYEEAHLECDKDSIRTHKKFLHILKTLLPEGCCPIIITDAGFRNPWFKLIESLNWDWIGRVRHLTLFQAENTDIWQPCKLLYSQAKLSSRHIGKVKLAKSNPMDCYFYLVKQKKKNRKKCNLKGHQSRCSVSLKHSKRENEPWLIATSLSPNEYTPKQIIAKYQKRMQIEEAFRDLKNQRNGFSLRESRTNNILRFENLLLIATIATIILWLIGLFAQNKNLNKQFQANTYHHRSVLSIIFLAKQVLMKIPKIIQKESVMKGYQLLLEIMEQS